jgi:hypothetical protein
MVRVAVFRLRRRIVCRDRVNNAETDRRRANLPEMRQPEDADDRALAFHASRVRFFTASRLRPLSSVWVHVRRPASETRAGLTPTRA